ncbi:acyl-CoA dehydrogenase [Caulobacter ginsengisoli]|uniref:Acyl-CoA dehydrogenase n=1 Tax=Caulobacter ginsengisoli TaxID=400775 RepID=A0ABU0IXB6_9CAUL|nr:acyl-CoA dehydrogenase family protein [Caulobacter ginsengisoli]MDQ0466020.1 acyl-CoA dehydrogenase [Caulobacter ginsengisoli]
MPAPAIAAATLPQPVDDDAFLDEVRAFLGRALTPDLRRAGRETLGVHADIAACRLWHRRLYDQGWIAPTWPAEWGGTGWRARQRYLFDRECAANDAPPLFAGGIRSLGPLLIEQGTPAQRARYLPAILDGRDLWCQGFSEPGAGSDLAAIATRAERRGEAYVVNGSKIWTTGAHHSNHMFAIVRTAILEKKQQGLTFLLIDMASPGLTVQPILGLSGEHEFNQVFFDDVAVPVENRVGAENDGWTMAKRLMQLARSNNTPAALVRRSLRRAQALAEAAGPDLEPAVRTALAGLEIELLSFEQLELASLPAGRPRPGDDTAPSMLKLIGTELNQRVCELALQAAGPAGLAALSSVAADDPWLDAGAHAAAKHLAVRAATIYSGSSETQRNVIAAQLLAR